MTSQLERPGNAAARPDRRARHLVADSGVSALDWVAGCSAEEIEDVISRALRDQLLAGVTTVRGLGDRRFCVLDHRDRHPCRTPGRPAPLKNAHGEPGPRVQVMPQWDRGR